jgi:cell division protein FtsZ
MNSKACPQENASGARPRQEFKMKFFGVGGVGRGLADYLQGAGFPESCLFAIDTDARDLAQSSLSNKYQLGARIARGIGAGRDPERGRMLAEKEAAELARLCEGADMVVIGASLGGGTGMGVSPVLARVAKEKGALVMAFAFYPFVCEGLRQQQQAELGMKRLRESSDAVMGLSTERLADAAGPSADLAGVFNISNELVAQGLKGIWRLLNRKGLIPLGFADIHKALSGCRQHTAFAVADAEGPDRAGQVAQKLLSHPWCQMGRPWDEAEQVLVGVTGGATLAMAEINEIMRIVQETFGQAHISMGAGLDDSLGGRVEVVLIASAPSRKTLVPAANQAAEPSAEDRNDGAQEGLQLGLPEVSEPAVSHSSNRLLAPPPDLTQEQAKSLMTQRGGKVARIKQALPRMLQAQLPLQIVSKGRFEKSEPTIHHGENLDVPTFLRRGMPMN